MTEPDDADLWGRMREGDADAFGLLFERHVERIHRYALRRTGDPSASEDVTAVVFLEVWRKRHDVQLHQRSALPWLYGVASNVLSHWHRSQRRHRAAMERFSNLPPVVEDSPEGAVEATAEAQRAVEQIRRLPVRQREVMVLSVWEGLSHAEIAEALGTTIGTVKSRLARARRRLDPDRMPHPDAPDCRARRSSQPLLAAPAHATPLPIPPAPAVPALTRTKEA